MEIHEKDPDYPKTGYDIIKAYSMEWLRVSDAVLVVQKGKEQSKGTQAEIEEANRLGIPVFDSLEDLARYEWA
jgi:hypothetical protein